MFTRPYVTDLRSEQTLQNIHDRLQNVGVNSIAADTFKGVSANGYLIAPSAAPTSPIMIPNGWATERLNFLMEVEVESNLTSKNVYYFQGYSDVYDPSLSGAIDERNMVFYINSYIAVSRAYYHGFAKDIILDNVNVVNGSMMTHAVGADTHMMRGIDIYHGMQSMLLSNTYGGSIQDTRMLPRMFSESKAVARKENNPNNYIASVFKASVYANGMSEIGGTAEDKISISINQLNNDNMATNPFVQYLSRIYGRPRTTHFTFQDLINLDNTVATRTHKMQKSSALASAVLPTGTDSANWDRSDATVQVATMFVNAVSSIMLELLLSNITIDCSNMFTVDGSIAVNIVGQPMSLSSADLSSHYSIFIARVINEVLYDLSYKNQVPFKIMASIDLFNESRLEVSMNNMQSVPYVVPSFSNSLFLPTISNNATHYNALVSDFDAALQIATPSTSVMGSPAVSYAI